MKKSTIIISVIVALVLIVSIMFFSIVSSKTIAAQINVESGTVMVNGQSITGNMELSEGDTIQTSSNGMATVILYESVVISLEPNTEITLDELTKKHPQVSQSSGETWNTFTKLFGVENYTIKSGNSVASVRGTSFIFTPDKIVVSEGRVSYVIDNQTYEALTDEVIEKIGEEIRERTLTAEERQAILIFKERAIAHLKWLREQEILKHPRTVDFVKKQYDITDQDIQQRLEEADQGLIDIEEVERQAPIEVESLHKVSEITKQIRKINEEIRVDSVI